MIDMKQAAAAATEFARTLFPESELRHLRLEEAELSQDGGRWLITLGWAEPAVRQLNPVMGTMRSDIIAIPRVYKQFIVDAENGKIHSMKIRDVDA